MTPRRAIPRHALRRSEAGATLAELLVVLAIISILAVTAVPFAETTAQRKKEIALQETLRTVRTAIDAFHQDWRANRFSQAEPLVSQNGYPRTLAALVTGVDVKLEGGGRVRRRYLRTAPVNPFAPVGAEPDRAWRLIGYAQLGTENWDRRDVYDLRAVTEREGLNGARIADW